jgi:hypothetical protein
MASKLGCDYLVRLAPESGKVKWGDPNKQDWRASAASAALVSASGDTNSSPTPRP